MQIILFGLILDILKINSNFLEPYIERLLLRQAQIESREVLRGRQVL